MELTARGYHSVFRVARTLADLDGGKDRPAAPGRSAVLSRAGRRSAARGIALDPDPKVRVCIKCEAKSWCVALSLLALSDENNIELSKPRALRV
jgi:hypothetical protein